MTGAGTDATGNETCKSLLRGGAAAPPRQVQTAAKQEPETRDRVIRRRVTQPDSACEVFSPGPLSFLFPHGGGDNRCQVSNRRSVSMTADDSSSQTRTSLLHRLRQDSGNAGAEERRKEPDVRPLKSRRTFARQDRGSGNVFSQTGDVSEFARFCDADIFFTHFVLLDCVTSI